MAMCPSSFLSAHERSRDTEVVVVSQPQTGGATPFQSDRTVAVQLEFGQPPLTRTERIYLQQQHRA
jgi:hypothetical protein